MREVKGVAGAKTAQAVAHEQVLVVQQQMRFMRAMQVEP